MCQTLSYQAARQLESILGIMQGNDLSTDFSPVLADPPQEIDGGHLRVKIFNSFKWEILS